MESIDRTLDETDLALIDAVQMNPRAGWASLGQVLELSGMTVSRRWQRLVDTGAAWVTVHFNYREIRGAVLEIACRPSEAMDVAMELAELPYVITVGVTTGRYQVFALIVAPSLREVSQLLAMDLPLPNSVIEMNSYLFSDFYGGVVWRLGILNTSKASRVRMSTEPSLGEVRPLSVEDRRLFLALGHDGRKSFTDLAEEVGSSPNAVRRRVDRLLRHGDITFRCDVARPMAGWHSMALIWISVPDSVVDEVGRGLGAIPETRHCSSVTGPANLLLILSLRSLEHLGQLLRQIDEKFPLVNIIDRRVVLRQVKIYGRIVDEWGRSTRAVPVDPWSLQD